MVETNDMTDYCPKCDNFQDQIDELEIECDTLETALSQVGAHRIIKDFILALMRQNEALRGAMQSFGVHDSLIDFITTEPFQKDEQL